jgi:hypothetical protein
MKRFWAMLTSLGLFLAVGCTSKSYDLRLEKTLENRKYQSKLDEALTPAVAAGKLKEYYIYIRPPKDLKGPTQAFQLAVVQPGRFDLENSFIEKDKQALHILARVKRPKPPAKKGAAPVPTPPRGEFNTDVLELLKGVYGVDLPITSFKEETKRKNTFRHRTIDLDPKTVQVYLYGAKNNPYEVALIFEYPKTAAAHSALNPKIGYCLESFAVGERAKRAFEGATTEEELEEAGEASGPPI